MWTMILYEFKKMFHSPLQKMLPLVVILLPMIYSLYFNDIENEATCKEFYQSIKGEMNEAWFANLETYYTVDEYGELAIGDSHTDPIEEEAYQLSRLKSDTLEKSWNYWSDKQTFIKNEMNKKNFYFDDYLPWTKLILALNMFGIFYAIYIAITITPVFSQEYNEHMSESIKTTKLGKYKAGISKTICSLSLILALPIISYSLYYLVILLTEGLPDGAITLSVISRSINPFTYQQEFLYGFITTITGGLSICAISLLISNFIKNSYVSMAISLCLLLLPAFFIIRINGLSLMQLFPFWFMMVSKVYESSPFIMLGDMTMYYKDFIVLLWIPLSTLLLVISIIKYRIREA